MKVKIKRDSLYGIIPKVDLPEGKSGDWEIERFSVSEELAITSEVREKMDQDAELARLRLKADWLHALCGEMLACLRVNMERGTLTTQDDQEFGKWVDRWEKRWREV